MVPSDAEIAAVATLADPVRRALYEFVSDQDQPVDREDAGRRVGVSARLAAFHLDKLVRLGLLRSKVGRPEGEARRPGRAPKLYERADTELAVCVPPRHYDLIGEILLDAISAVEADERSGTTERRAVWDAAMVAAYRKGVTLGCGVRAETRPGRLGVERALSAVSGPLAEFGYEPHRADPNALRMRNCPFHRLATRSPGPVCALNHAFVSGILAGLDARTVSAVREPTDGQCCVEIRGYQG